MKRPVYFLRAKVIPSTASDPAMKRPDSYPVEPRPVSVGALILALAVMMAATTGQAQNPGAGFDSGSDGSLGDVVITNHTTLTLPPDGVLHFKSFHLKAQVRLDFIRNAANTPVYLLSQGDVVLDGILNVSGGGSLGTFGPGMGGPGGFDGGQRGLGEVPPGDGHGPGGGRAGLENGANLPSSAGGGSFATQRSAGSTNVGAMYGNSALIPLIGGSGGGGTPSAGGGGGGGAILIASNTRIVFGIDGSQIIEASGGEWGTSGAWNGGSGGAVKLVAPHITGPARIRVTNRNTTGGSGRVRLDALNYAGVQFGHISPPETFTYGSMLATGIEASLPKLELVSVAGSPLPGGTGAEGFILLPNGSDAEQPVVVRAQHFGTRVDVRVIVQPERGPSWSYPVQMDNRTANPASATVMVNIPANTPVKVYAWTE